ncbi:MAG: insulinase family protein, partial [Myxococcales bacterium]|nr:insulinase family protein [Myxococcales bacterium]
RTKASLTGAQVDLADEPTPERARTFDASLGEGRVQHDRFANGLRVVAVDQGRMPFVDLLLVAPAPALPAGLDELVLAAFQHDAEHEGNVLLSDLGLSLGPDTWVLRARAMSSELDKGMKALRQLVDTQKVNGAVAADRLGRIRRIRRSLAREAERWPWVDAEARALEPAWRGPLLLQGDEARADLATARAKDLDALLAATFRPSRSVLVVAGSVEAWDGVESARGAFSDWKGRPAAPPTYALPPAAPLATQGLLLDEEEATQAIVSLTCVATDAGEAARHEEAVADLLSRALYLTLREELGWAYSPFAVGDHQRDRARYTLLATVPLDRLEPTVAHLRSLLRRAEQEGFDERTLEDLRTRQVLQTPLRRQTRWSVAHSLAEALLEGHSVEDWRQVVPLVSDLGTDEVKQALKGCAEHELVVVRGPASRIPDTVREALGGTWEVVEPNEDAKENR